MREDRWEERLRDLARVVEFPPAPDVTENVRRRLVGEPEESRWRPRLAAALTAAVVLLSGFLMAAPGARRAVADFLGFEEIRVRVGPRPVATSARPTASPSEFFGRLVTREEAAAATPFRLPEPRRLRSSPDYFLDEALPGHLVTVAYPAGRGLPEIEGTGYGAIVSALQDFPPEQFFGKLLGGSGAFLDEVKVAGTTGYWAEGDEHSLTFGGEMRSSGNALLWQSSEGITYRLETMLSLRRAVEIAASLPR